MPNIGNIYALGMQALVSGAASLLSADLQLALVGPLYTPDLVNDQYWSALQIYEFTDPGYTAGGNTLVTPTVTVTTAANWPLSYPTSGSAVLAGALISNGTYLYRAANAGTASAPPVFPTTEGETVVDGYGITWTNVGSMVLVFNCADGYAWVNIATAGLPYGVIYDDASGNPATDPLLVLLTFNPPLTNTPSGPVTINPDPQLGYLALPIF